MIKRFDNRKLVEHQGHLFGVLILPVLSISKPSPDPRFGSVYTQRIVFDWGKSLSHPSARVAFGMLTRPEGHYFPHIIINDKQYLIEGVIQRCRSGRRAAIVTRGGSASMFDTQLIQKALAQEFPQI